jgi:signal transduction histidine kinase
MTAVATAQPDQSVAGLPPQDLAEVLQAYSAVAERLQASHETLQNQVAKLQEELASKNAQLERSKRLSALGEMAAGIAHEIRNPLAAIQLYAEMVEQDVDAEVGQRQDEQPNVGLHTDEDEELLSPAVGLDAALGNTRKIVSAVRGLSAIVVDVLSFARQIEPVVKPLNPAEVLQRVADAHRPAIEQGEVEVRIKHDDHPIHADAELLHQALLNLARNAVDAMAQTDKPRVLKLESTKGRITVADTGPGLDEQAIDRIFNPFFTTRATGTGLGLAIVHRIVDAHGGTIAVRNDGRTGGAVFKLTLPKLEIENWKSEIELADSPG